MEDLESIKETIRQALEHYVGETPAMADVKEAAERLLRSIVDITNPEAKLVEQLVMVQFGLASAVELEKQLKAAPDWLLELIWERLGANKFLALELARRAGRLRDWHVVSEKMGEMSNEVDVQIFPHKPVEYIQLSFIVTDKEANES